MRTGSIAAAIGLGIGIYAGRLAAVPLATLGALWFTLGGHYVEVLFRNRVGPAIGAVWAAMARPAYWFAGGSVLYAGALLTRAGLTGRPPVAWPWWAGGVGFVALELVVHGMLYARGAPSFYDGRG